MSELFSYILKMKFLDGYRTYIAAVGMIGLSVYSFAEGNFDLGMTQIMAALGALGLYEKVKAPTPTPTPLPDVAAPVVITPQPITPEHPLIAALIAAVEEKLKKAT